MSQPNSMSKSKNRTQGNDLGTLLRRWRGARNKSQMEASLDAGVSQRHLSFIEIGRSVPSRETLIGIAEALEIPYRDRNPLLLAAPGTRPCTRTPAGIITICAS
jgi:transcriptional regulator with XRE-family HTH domain